MTEFEKRAKILILALFKLTTEKLEFCRAHPIGQLGHNDSRQRLPTHAYKASCAFEQKAHGPAAYAYACAYVCMHSGHGQWVWLKWPKVFVMIVGRATQF